jgi:hypothetical protein
MGWDNFWMICKKNSFGHPGLEHHFKKSQSLRHGGSLSVTS